MMFVHWDAFALAFHGWSEPIERALIEAERAEVSLLAPQIGETVQLHEDTSFPPSPWWELQQERDEIAMTNPLTIELNITIGDKVFLARLYDNETTHALIEKLPLSIDMEDLYRNEKFYYL